ncbi:MAG TPA: hypothetical protein VLI94_11255 [Solirubrobacterales bacterium]|nr:hypothetical protein [Solirubrobacterales bacterium]
MLGPGRYLLGVAEILLLGGFAWLGGAAVRQWLLPRFEGAPAHLASAVIALALLIWAAELLGTFGWLDPVPYLLLVAALAVVARGSCRRRGPTSPEDTSGEVPPTTPPARGASLVGLLIAVVAVVHFSAGVKTRLSTGMTGFDSTWYHGPFAAGFFQSGDTWDLHFIAPQFLAWFYPANAEIFHGVGMLAFGRDILSPLLNLGWFVGCLVACWCIGRPFKVAPWSLALGAIALSVPALADQAGEARNDIVGIFFLLAAVAIALNGERDVRTALVAGLAAGLMAGTKLNFLLPAAVLVVGFAAIAPRGERGRVFGAATLAALAGGGYWYLRNLVHSGNPLPWIDSLGPISLPAPDQALGGREAHSVLGYLTDGSVWSDWFLPGLHDGLWFLWPLLLLAALAGLVLACTGKRTLVLAGAAGLATALAWLVAPTSASGPDGMPRGFESGLRYLAPALVLGLALLPTSPRIRVWLSFGLHKRPNLNHTAGGRRGLVAGIVSVAILLVVALGYPVQRHYLENRYADPSFTAPGLNAAFAWARDVSGARIATASTRQYPLYGTDLSNEVEYVGLDRPHGGFESPATCREYLLLLSDGNYDYAIATRDRTEPGKPPYPPSAQWTEAAGGKPILKKPPSVVFELPNRLRPSACS